MTEEDRSYYRARAVEENRAALRATCPEAARAHRGLALSYTALVQEPAIAPMEEGQPISSRVA